MERSLLTVDQTVGRLALVPGLGRRDLEEMVDHPRRCVVAALEEAVRSVTLRDLKRGASPS